MTQKSQVQNKRPGEAARILGVTPQTLRNYVTEFGSYLSIHAKRSTGRRYTPEDLAILSYAAESLRDGLTYDQVRQDLEDRPLTGEILEDYQPEDPDRIGIGEERGPEGEQTGSEIAPIEFFQEIISQMQDQHQREIAAKDDLIAELREDKKRLQDQISRPWWKRIFGG